MRPPSPSHRTDTRLRPVVLVAAALGILILAGLLGWRSGSSHGLVETPLTTANGTKPAPGRASLHASAIPARAPVRPGPDNLARFRDALARLAADDAQPLSEIRAALAACERSDMPEVFTLAAARGVFSGGDATLGRMVFARWAQLDPAAALDQALALDHADSRPEALLAAVEHGGPRDLENGLPAFLAAQLPAEHRGELFALLLKSAPDRTPGQLGQFISRLAPEDRGAARSAALEVLATHDPAQASAWLETLPAADWPEAASARIAETWAARAPQEAAAWALRLSGEDDARDAALAAAVRVWAAGDARATAEFLAQQPDAPWQDAAASVLAEHFGGQEPLQALRWVARIHDAEHREEAHIGVLRAWHATDATGFESWLAAALPDAAGREQWMNWLRWKNDSALSDD